MSIHDNQLFCHGCDRRVRFELDRSINGNHEITCPNCGHVHYRVIENGRITSVRYTPGMRTVHVYAYMCTSSSTDDYCGDLWYRYSDSGSTG